MYICIILLYFLVLNFYCSSKLKVQNSLCMDNLLLYLSHTFFVTYLLQGLKTEIRAQTLSNPLNGDDLAV